MTQLIDKSAVVAEIERRIKKYATIDVGNSSELDALYGAKCKALMEILSFLDTLEVKEVGFENELDFNAEVSQFIDTFYKNTKIGHKLMIRRTARYFFELGLKTSNGE